jgi:voltage-gated potassium channel
MLKEFKYIFILIFTLFFIGTLGYHIIEKWSIFESLYMTIITVSTTGFMEVRPLSEAGRVFTIVLILAGLIFLFYAIGILNAALFERNFFKERAMQKKISALKNHYIICGFGRMGEKIAQELASQDRPFIVIEKEPARLESMAVQKYLYIEGDATEDDNLHKAGISNARGLVATLDSDISNVFATLSARGMNPNLKIIARAEEESSRQKLLRSGADRVVLPYEIGGFRIAQALLRPTVLAYFDEIFSRSSIGLEIDEICLTESSPLLGKTLAESNIRSNFNLIIVAIYRHTGDIVYNPGSNTKLSNNDTLIVIGKADDLRKIQKII